MKGVYQYVAAAVIGAALATAAVISLATVAQFDQYINTFDAERELILAMHVAEEVRLFAESAMNYALRGAIPIALEGGGHPGPLEYKGVPTLDRTRYWGWCESRKSAPIDCSIGCDYTTFEDLNVDEEEMLSNGTGLALEGILEDYAQSFMQRQTYGTVIKPNESSVVIDGDDASFETWVNVVVFTVAQGKETPTSRGLVNSTDLFETSFRADGLTSLISEGKNSRDSLRNSISDVAADIDSIKDTDDWVEEFKERIVDPGQKGYYPGGYDMEVDVLEFENATDCEDVTIKVRLSTQSSDYKIYTPDGRLASVPLNLTFLVQNRYVRP